MVWSGDIMKKVLHCTNPGTFLPYFLVMRYLEVPGGIWMYLEGSGSTWRYLENLDGLVRQYHEGRTEAVLTQRPSLPPRPPSLTAGNQLTAPNITLCTLTMEMRMWRVRVKTDSPSPLHINSLKPMSPI